MMQFLMKQTKTYKEPKPLKMEQVCEAAEKIPHNRQQNLCVVLEEADYLDVVIYNEQVESSFGRFVIGKDYLWTDEEERHFAKLLWEENAAFDAVQLREINRRFAMSNPQWHLKKYTNKPLRMFDHIYSCMNPYGVKEILYKAGLDELASRLYGIEDYNMIGTSPAEIFGGLSMRTLRAMNHPYGVYLMETEIKRQKLLALQNHFSWIFEKKWNEAMCRYMCRLLQGNEGIDEVAKKFRKEYQALQNFWTNGQYQDYINRVCQREELEKRLEPELMAELTGERVSEVYRMLIVEEELWNGRIMRSNEIRDLNMECSDENYLIYYPRTIEDFVREAIMQKNCLLDYCYCYVENRTDILFLRRREKPYESFVTVEIMDGELVQAREKCNGKTSEDVIRWIEGRISKGNPV